ncbi:hypothetical protein ABZW47_31205 [Streptomyces sp. NPDC004549]|uniref:hypothetical protein n=1 Tax=Streptomyces sp. NPDC004549 TaxID=3154283 RepID=UPI0033AE8FF1
MAGMVRGAPSRADLQVIRELAARELVVTASQLESWRRAGLLPRHRRRGLGRGRGTVVDAVDPVVVESAAALARHLRQGRDRRLAVLEWFAEAGMPPVRPGAVPVPEPPIGAVREALLWALEGSFSQRLWDTAHSAVGAGEAGLDELYRVAGLMLAARPYRGAMANPALMRAALEAGEDLPEETGTGADFARVVHLVAAIGAGAEEIGADALAEAFAVWDMFGLTVEDWKQMLGAAERGEGPPVDWDLLRQHADVLGPVRRAGDEELVRARAVLLGLRGFYGMYVLHGLVMPDTPAQAALRQRIDEWGMFPFLSHAFSFSPSPVQFAESLSVCLEPLFDGLYEALMEQLARDPDIFRLPGDETGPVGFGERWMRALREVSAEGSAGHSRTDDPDKRS